MEVPMITTGAMKTIFLAINCLILAIGNCGGPLVMRLYFIRGGKRIWFTSWLETGGFPIILIPLLAAYVRRRKSEADAQLFLMKPRLFFGSAAIGILTGLDDYLYAYGVAKIPISTCALIVATHLGFTATFAFLLVKHKFTAYSVNAVVLLTVGVVVLGLHASGDRPEGEKKEYILGFFMTMSAAALYGFILPLVELMYLKAKQALNYTLVLEVQLVMCFFATAFCTVGMVIDNDLQVIPREAKEFQLGEAKYYNVIICSAILWQCFFLGVVGVIFYSSSLLSGIVITVLLPLTQLLAVLFYHEKFQPEKGVSLFLAVWGFISYFYGEFKSSKNNNVTMSAEREMIAESHQTAAAAP